MQQGKSPKKVVEYTSTRRRQGNTMSKSPGGPTMPKIMKRKRLIETQAPGDVLKVLMGHRICQRTREGI